MLTRAADAIARTEANNGGRYLRYLIVLLLVLTLAPIPIYIYVLEIHSTALAHQERVLEGLTVRVSHIEAAVTGGSYGRGQDPRR